MARDEHRRPEPAIASGAAISVTQKPKDSDTAADILTSMGPALPYAIAAQLAYPWWQSVAIAGDGAFTMLMGEMATAVRHNLPIKVFLFKNNSMGMVRFEQEGKGQGVYGVDLQPIDFAWYAQACGAEGYSCSTPDEVESTIKKALASKRPTLVELVVDPEEVPMDPSEFKEVRG